jgi:hypothetical protein
VHSLFGLHAPDSAPPILPAKKSGIPSIVVISDSKVLIRIEGSLGGKLDENDDVSARTHFRPSIQSSDMCASFTRTTRMRLLSSLHRRKTLDIQRKASD